MMTSRAQPFWRRSFRNPVAHRLHQGSTRQEYVSCLLAVYPSFRKSDLALVEAARRRGSEGADRQRIDRHSTISRAADVRVHVLRCHAFLAGISDPEDRKISMAC